MNSLEPGRIEEAGGVAEDHPSVAGDGRDRPPTAIGHGLRAIADHLAAFEQLGDKWMLLEFLQHVLGIEPRIGIVESGDETERNYVVFRAVDPGAAVFLRGQRPAHRVNDLSHRDPARWNFPEFLDANAVSLRICVFGQVEFLDEILGERSARTLGENDDFGMEVVAGLKVRFRMAFLVDALVVGTNSGDAISFEKQFGASKSGEDSDASLFDLAAEPLHKAIERDHVVAMVAEWWRRDGQLELGFLSEKVNRFFGDLGIERSFLFESGKQFAHRARIEQRSGEAVLADLAGFFENINVLFAELGVGVRGIVRVDELRQAQRTSHAGWAAADNYDVGGHLRTFNAFDGFAEN